MSYSLVSSGDHDSSTASSNPLNQDAPRYSSSEPLVGDNLEAGHDEGLSKTTHHHRYMYSVIALIVALFSFILQTETTGYLSNSLGYRKPFLLLYLTHSSWTFLWPCQILFLRLRKLNVPFGVFLHRHIESVKKTASIVHSGARICGSTNISTRRYFLRVCFILALALNAAGSSWYVAINMTTPGDVTAIYNCSAFFAYFFSVVILHEHFSWKKMGSVLLAVLGVVIVAYSGGRDKDNADQYPYRTFGNILIGVGAVVYGLYEVLYKRLACPVTNAVSARRESAFAIVISFFIGSTTMLCLWPIVPIMHYTGVEKFELPSLKVSLLVIVSIMGNALFSGSFLIMMALTSPVLSSVAALLTTFLVSIVDWLIFGTTPTLLDIIGNIIIVVAFTLLSYASWQDIQNDGPDDD